MTRGIRKFIAVLSAAVITAAALAFPVTVFADADISMTTSTGNAEVAGDIEVTVQITSDEQIGTYFIELEYDSTRMRYVRGADSELDGIITLTGTGMSRNVRYDLKFTGATGGEAGIIVRNALVNDTSGNAVNTTDSGMLQIMVNGQTDNAASFTQKLAEEDELFDGGLPISGTIHDADGNTLYVVDLARTTPDVMFFPFELKEEQFEGQMLTFAVNKDNVIKMIPLTDAEDNVSLYAVNGDMFYPVTDYTDSNGTRFAYVSLEACSTMPQKIASDTEMWDYTVYAVGRDGSGGFYLINEQGGLELYTVLNATTLTGAGLFSKIFSGAPIPWERYLIIAAGVIILVIILVIALTILFRLLKKRKIRKAIEYQYDYSIEEPVSVDEDINDIDVIRKREDVIKEVRKTPASVMAKKADEDRADADRSLSGRNVVRVDDVNTGKPKKKAAEDEAAEAAIDAVEVRAEKSAAEANEAPADKAEDIDEDDGLLSLDDIVLTAEDVPGTPENVYRIPSGDDAAADKEPAPEPDAMGKTIRFEKVPAAESKPEIQENEPDGEPEEALKSSGLSGDTEAIVGMLENIDLYDQT